MLNVCFSFDYPPLLAMLTADCQTFVVLFLVKERNKVLFVVVVVGEIIVRRA